MQSNYIHTGNNLVTSKKVTKPLVLQGCDKHVTTLKFLYGY